ncbi:hypothetical protein, partial [Nocardia wallacei]|uniref:hypothetical protein n=1 Tax=Nocardia wallacei TaxID=480035 RepID=UPI0024556150
VQQMIRQAQSYVIVCGGLPGRRWPQQALTDVVGGAVGPRPAVPPPRPSRPRSRPGGGAAPPAQRSA